MVDGFQVAGIVSKDQAISSHYLVVGEPAYIAVNGVIKIYQLSIIEQLFIPTQFVNHCLHRLPYIYSGIWAWASCGHYLETSRRISLEFKSHASLHSNRSWSERAPQYY